MNTAVEPRKRPTQADFYGMFGVSALAGFFDAMLRRYADITAMLGYAIGWGMVVFLIPCIVMFFSKSARAGWSTFAVIACLMVAAAFRAGGLANT